jgi:putative Mn2+ efflux pump MntP
MAWALAMDAFAVAAGVAAGLDRLTFRHIFRLTWHFGLFQAGMPVLGWTLGLAISSFAAAFAYGMASGLLLFIGARMIWESLGKKSRPRGFDPTKGLSLVVLSLATSMDALAVGISLGLIGASIWIPAIVIGLVTMFITAFGIGIGRGAGRFLGVWAERLGGVVLIIIGIRAALSH